MWVRKDDNETEHPKVLKLIQLAGYEGYYRRDRLIGWCARLQTHGAFTAEVAQELGIKSKVLETMVKVGLVDRNGNGYVVHDFDDYNAPLSDAERSRRYRARKRDEE